MNLFAFGTYKYTSNKKAGQLSFQATPSYLLAI